jgi:ATP-dependent RNA helicase RhlB
MSNEIDAPQADVKRVEPAFLTDVRFQDFDLPEAVITGIQDAGFSTCTPIQAQSLPDALAGKDIAGQAQTGTGKTAAFLITIFTRLIESGPLPGQPAAIIVAPTRELALQIYEEAQVLGGHTQFSMAVIIGGVDYDKQAEALKNGVDIIICTPGRVIDYHKQGIFKTDNIRILVIDEADRLLDMGFERDMRYILKSLPPYHKRQSLLFSATLSHRVMELTYEYMNLPEFIAIAPEEVAVERIEQALFHIDQENKLPLMLGILKREDWSRMLIFVNTKAGVEWLTKKLKGNGWPAEGITGDLPQRKRFHLMDQYKKGRIKILIATDVASRGIHVEDISHVINYDLPQDAENYVHRIGRTARAGKSGRAISLACENYVFHLEALENMLTYKIPVIWADETWFEADSCGPVAVNRKKHHPKAPVRSAPPTKKINNRRRSPFEYWQATIKKNTENYFPGAFFGFEPVRIEDKRPIGTSAVRGKMAQMQMRKRGKRRTKQRRRRQTNPAGTEN